MKLSFLKENFVMILFGIRIFFLVEGNVKKWGVGSFRGEDVFCRVILWFKVVGGSNVFV